MVSERQLFYCIVPKFLMWMILRVVSNIVIYWQIWYSLPSIIHFRKFHRQHQCALQLMWGHGTLLACTMYSVLYSEIALSRKPSGIVHMYICILYNIRVTWPLLTTNCTMLGSLDQFWPPIVQCYAIEDAVRIVNSFLTIPIIRNYFHS
jgi:hypothetical protein